MVAFLVPKKMLGTAYGFMQSIQNLGLAVMYVFFMFAFYLYRTPLFSFRNIFTGLILDSYGYFMLEIFFIICLEIALLAAAFLYVYNSVKKGMLNDSPAVRRVKQAEIDAKTNTIISNIVESPASSEDDNKVSYT